MAMKIVGTRKVRYCNGTKTLYDVDTGNGILTVGNVWCDGKKIHTMRYLGGDDPDYMFTTLSSNLDNAFALELLNTIRGA